MIDFLFKYSSLLEAHNQFGTRYDGEDGLILVGWQMHIITQIAEYDDEDKIIKSKEELPGIYWFVSIDEENEDELVRLRTLPEFVGLADRPQFLINLLSPDELKSIVLFEPVPCGGGY